MTSLRLAIVGSGPAGGYTAGHILRHARGPVSIDIIEALPVPHGLVRYGVAPDHPEAKNAIHRLEKSVYSDDQGRVRFLGGVALGSDIQARELSKAYHGVILAYGASSDRKLGLKGEERGPSSGIFSSSEFVGWYNGHPSLSKASELTFKDHFSNPTTTPKRAIIIGQGNVALDMARVLLKPLTELRSTDMASRAIEALSHSKLQEIRIVGRRGPLQASFTAKEVRELTKLPHTRILIDNPLLLEEAVASLDPLKERSHKRVLELLLKNASSPATHDATRNDRDCALDFFQKPVELHFNDDTGRIQAVTFERTLLDKTDGRVVGTGQTFKKPCDILLKSIGYASVPYPGLPWNAAKCIIPNNRGRVHEDTINTGLYVAGWLKRGPTGTIATSLFDATETADAVLEDWVQLITRTPSTTIDSILSAKKIRPVTFDDWKRIDAAEERAGMALRRPREKMTDVSEMLRIAHSPE